MGLGCRPLAGAFDHLIIASTLPVFMPRDSPPPGWNEALCAGRLGGRVARSERAPTARSRPRALVGLQPFLRASLRLAAPDRQAARRRPRTAIDPVARRRRALAYVSEVDLRTSDHACRVFQLHVLALPQSAFPEERRIIRATGSRASGIVFFALARLAGVDAPSAEWRPPAQGRRSTTRSESSCSTSASRASRSGAARGRRDVERLVVLHTTELADRSGESNRPRRRCISTAQTKGD